MSAYSDYKHGYITEDQYKAEMRRECGEVVDDLPFYDADEYYKCENCVHCKDVSILKRVIKTHPEMWHDQNGIQHVNNSTCVAYVSRDWTSTEYEHIFMCERLLREVGDTDTCEDFEEGEQ